MNRIIIDESCTNCGLCLNSCAFGALVPKKIMTVNDSCTLCLLCIDACPTASISLSQSKVKSYDNSEYTGILIVGQTDNNGIHPVTKELIGEANRLKNKGEKTVVVLVGYNHNDLVDDLKRQKIDVLYSYDHKDYKNFSAYNFTSPIVDTINLIKPNIVLFGATLEGRSLAPSVAIGCKTGLTADCIGLHMDNRDLIQTRPAYGGNVMAEIITKNHRPQMATVRPGIMKREKDENTSYVEVIKITDKPKLERHVEIIEEKTYDNKGIKIEDSKIVFAVGKGVSEKNIERLLTIENDNIKIGCTRAVVERGDLDISRQIGLSGKAISPGLLITLGVSGSVQFLAGIESAKRIIAVDNDPEAKIFFKADRGIICDANEIINQILEKRKKKI